MRIEMADGQAPLGVGKYSVFTNVVATNVRPDLVGTNAAVPAMVKMSTNGKGVFDNAGGSPAIFVAVNSSSSNASANGRRITAARWGRVGLGVPSTAPSWFLVGPRGITNAPSPSVEGRFAYAVYDLGSLVDINVAGYPSSVTSTQHRALEGSLAGLDLAGLGLSQAETDSLITGFRNHTSGGSATNYVNHVLNVAGPGGFLTVSPGDDIFLSRQDFLTYAGLRGLGTNVTGNFSTFTRTSLTPAWAPTTNGTPTSIQTVSRANIVAWNPSAGASRTVKTETFDYKDGFANPASINRGPLTQPVTGAFTRLDGTTAQVGEPLVLRRFPLSRLAWLSRSGPSSVAVSRFGTVAAAATRIKQAFGLVWDTTNNPAVITSSFGYSPQTAPGSPFYNASRELFVDAALRRYVTDPTQDTGSLAGDLLVIQREQVAMYTDPLALGLLTLILNACMDDPVTADSFSTRFLHPRREATVRVLERAVARDEIPPVDDMEYVLDHVSGSFLLRGSMPGTDPIDEAFARRTIVSVLRDLGVPDPLAAVEEAARTLQDDDPHAKERHP